MDSLWIAFNVGRATGSMGWATDGSESTHRSLREVEDERNVSARRSGSEKEACTVSDGEKRHPRSMVSSSRIDGSTIGTVRGTRCPGLRPFAFSLALLFLLVFGPIHVRSEEEAGGVISASRVAETDQATNRDLHPRAQDSISPSWTPKLLEENPPPSFDPFLNASFYYVYMNPENGSRLLEKMDFPQGKLDGKKETNPVEDNRAVCPNNTPLDALFPSGRDVCRVFINFGQNGWGLCTGTFVYSYGETRWYTVVSAAHCFVDAQKAWEIEPLDSAPSYVCCSAPESGGNTIDQVCPLSGRFRIRAVTIPKSYTQRAEGVSIDDGAVLAVVPYESTVQDKVPYAWGFYLRKSICTTTDEFLYAGYPGLSNNREGCTENNIVRGYLHSSTSQGLLNCQQATSGESGMIYQGSSCPGMSGGPLISRIDNADAIVGILSGSSIQCSQSGTSGVWFARTTKKRRVPGFQPKRLVKKLKYNKLKAVR